MSQIKFKINRKSALRNNSTYVAEPIEKIIQRRLANKEPLDDKVNLLYYDISEGVKAGYDVRTDRFDLALDGVGAIQKSETAKTQSMTKEVNTKTEENTATE